ncbi:MAG: hypothetical protein IT425_03070 [Pirellulales bacterium]|nr:hypothetical protein [Pirellulales bacterium]
MKRTTAKKPEATTSNTRREVSKDSVIKRLTIDIPSDLHRAIKVSCAKRGAKMADEIRSLLVEKYGK